MDNTEAKDQAGQTITGDFTVVWNNLTNRPGWAVLSPKEDGSKVPYFLQDGDMLEVLQVIETVWDGMKKEILWPVKERRGLAFGEVTEADLYTTAEAYRLLSEEFQKYTPSEWFGGNRRATVTVAQPMREDVGSAQPARQKILENV